MPFIEESVPTDTMKSLLDDNWKEYKEIPKPQLIVANEPEEPYCRFNLDDGDVIIIRSDAPESIKYRGNISYIDRIHSLTLSIWTKESRQRIGDLYKMIRAICLTKKHNFSGWQLIRLINYQEMVNQELNIWRGELRLQLENHAVRSDEL